MSDLDTPEDGVELLHITSDAPDPVEVLSKWLEKLMIPRGESGEQQDGK